MPRKIAILTINDPSYESAKKLKNYLFDEDITIFKKERDFEKVDDILPTLWKNFDAIICILAVGAVVRKIAPFLKDKSTDPAVLVINLNLDRVIPLLGGHLGGANEIAQKIASKIPNCINFVTTATDQKGVISFEMFAKKENFRILNLKSLANISNRLLNSKTVKIFTCKEIFELLKENKNLKLIKDKKEIDSDTVVIYPYVNSSALTLIPKISLGIGCNKNTTKKEINEAFLSFLEKYKLKKEDISQIGSFEAKSTEIGLLEFAKENDFSIIFFSKEQINSVNHTLSKSKATQFFEIKGVAEPSAVLLSKYKELVFKKEVYKKKITIAGAI